MYADLSDEEIRVLAVKLWNAFWAVEAVYSDTDGGKFAMEMETLYEQAWSEETSR